MTLHKADTLPHISIVGAGLAGLTAAAFFADAGCSITLHSDKPLTPPPFTRQMILTPFSLAFLKRLPWHLEPSGALKRVHVSTPNHWAHTVLSNHDAKLEQLGWFMDYQTLISTLQDFVSSHPKITFTTETVHRLEQLSDWRMLAHGSHSPLHRQLALEHYMGKKITITQALMEVSQPSHAQAWQRFAQTGTWAAVPQNDQNMMIIHSGEALSIENNQWLNQAQHSFSGQLSITRSYEPRSWTLQQYYTHPKVPPRTWLLGDAAMTMAPIGAQGYNLILRDLSSYLVGMLNRESEKQHHNRVLHRLKGHQKVFRTNQILQQAFCNKNIALNAIRSMAFLTLNQSSFLKKKVIAKGMGFDDLAQIEL